MNLLILQHDISENPGFFRTLFERDGHRCQVIELDEGDALPSFDGVDGLWVMGGGMDTWQEAEHPWLIAEKHFIRQAVVERGLPFFGACLGHQLLAEALGGKCAPAQQAEIGVLDVALNEAGCSNGFFEGVPNAFRALQWHGAEVTQLPEGAEILANSSACANQAMVWGRRALSLQFHIEAELDTVENWVNVPDSRAILERELGADAVPTLRADCAASMASFNAIAERIYENWMRLAGA